VNRGPGAEEQRDTGGRRDQRPLPFGRLRPAFASNAHDLRGALPAATGEREHGTRSRTSGISISSRLVSKVAVTAASRGDGSASHPPPSRRGRRLGRL